MPVWFASEPINTNCAPGAPKPDQPSKADDVAKVEALNAKIHIYMYIYIGIYVRKNLWPVAFIENLSDKVPTLEILHACLLRHAT